MSEYPGFVPRFGMGRYRAWGARDPRRVIAWFGGHVLVAAVALIIGAVVGSFPLIAGGAVGLAWLAVEGAIYVPRALRVMQDTTHARPRDLA
jgi:NaMN:DMB phosphoribosyltransferase